MGHVRPDSSDPWHRLPTEVVTVPTRNVFLSESEDAARLAALRRAADKGWADLASGQYQDMDDDDLADVIAQLGTHA